MAKRLISLIIIIVLCASLVSAVSFTPRQKAYFAAYNKYQKLDTTITQTSLKRCRETLESTVCKRCYLAMDKVTCYNMPKTTNRRQDIKLAQKYINTKVFTILLTKEFNKIK